MNKNLILLQRKLYMLKEEKMFIKQKINLNYNFPKERDRLFIIMLKCQNKINEVKKEIENVKNNNSIK